MNINFSNPVLNPQITTINNKVVLTISVIDVAKYLFDSNGYIIFDSSNAKLEAKEE